MRASKGVINIELKSDKEFGNHACTKNAGQGAIEEDGVIAANDMKALESQAVDSGEIAKFKGAEKKGTAVTVVEFYRIL